ncbi:MAG TPA: hypothetical protein VJ673_17305 [Aromatoleum sp.]|uniref:hypothetical protein n=1 Tax=Aromatoleum sp. TaxID=2307007 RepID=UPI002B489B95|nr:hypothetical protein [Aromatoleum sp.]HJV27449.1 hypothetical protein [Aromatoleum sp.]
MKDASSVIKKVGPDMFSTGAARRDEGTVKILSDLDPAQARVDPDSDVVGSRAAMLLFFAVVIPAVFMLALWHREQTEALEVRMSPMRAELPPVVAPQARTVPKDAVAGNSTGNDGADGAARIVSSAAAPSAETAMSTMQPATAVPARSLSSANALSREASAALHAADRSQDPAARPAVATRPEQGSHRPSTRLQAAATLDSGAGTVTRSSQHAAPAGPIAVAAESDDIQRDVEIITAIVRASSK